MFSPSVPGSGNSPPPAVVVAQGQGRELRGTALHSAQLLSPKHFIQVVLNETKCPLKNNSRQAFTLDMLLSVPGS